MLIGPHSNHPAVQALTRSLPTRSSDLHHVTHPDHCRGKQAPNPIAHALLRWHKLLCPKLHIPTHDQPPTKILLRTPPKTNPSHRPQQTPTNLQVLQGLRQMARCLCRSPGNVHGARRPAKNNTPRHVYKSHHREYRHARRPGPSRHRL